MHKLLTYGLALGWLLGAAPAGAQAQAGARPRVGLTLSGGGARGLAHVGLLQALDSAGLAVDYVTGTSMGAVVGSLYSAGYTGRDIERIALGIDWGAVLSNNPPLALVPLPERAEYDRYVVQLPLGRHGVQLSGGLLESEELWLTFDELFFPFYRLRSFDELYRPFRCVATDVVAGGAVVLGAGELPTAVRASMAIPSVFTPVQRGGRTLVDGGLVRNFPVSEARALGADYLIGSTVSAAVYTAADLKSPLDVLLQISSFQDNADVQQQRALCNLLVDYPLGSYTAGSFEAAPDLLRLGRQRGRALYPRLRALRDSLDRRYGPAPPRPAPPRADSVYVAALDLRGAPDSTGSGGAARAALLLRWMQLRAGRYYTAAQLSQALRRAYGTGYFRRLTYALQPLAGDSVRLALTATPAPPTRLGLGLQYNSAVGIGLIANLGTRDFLLPYSTSRVALNVGESPRLRLLHTQYLGRAKTSFARLLTQGESVALTPYDANRDRAGLYTQRLLLLDARLGRLARRQWAWGLGTRYEQVNYRPDARPVLAVAGTVRQLTSYLFAEANTLTAPVYPTGGLRLAAELGQSYAQASSLQARDAVSQQVYANPSRAYQQARLGLEGYRALSARATLQLQLQAGLSWHNQQVVANDYVLGGLTPVFRNQLTFAGLPEGGLFASSAVVALVGCRYALTPRLLALAKANVAGHDFIASNQRLQAAGTTYGAALGLGLKSPVGPIEANLMYSGLLGRLVPYFNIGIPFGYQ